MALIFFFVWRNILFSFLISVPKIFFLNNKYPVFVVSYIKKKRKNLGLKTVDEKVKQSGRKDINTVEKKVWFTLNKVEKNVSATVD